MHIFYSALFPRRLGAVLALLGLAGPAWAQHYNTGTSYNTGLLYFGDAFTNTGSSASFRNDGGSAQIYYAGPTFTNTASATYGASSGATDQFVGSGLQTLAGNSAPGFHNLTLANGSTSPFALTNTAGLDVAAVLTFSNGITTTVNNVAGAIRLASTATVSGSFSTARYVDGYVGKAGTTSFTYPLGATNQRGGNGPAVGAAIYSPITVSSPGGTTLRYVADQPANTTVLATQAPPLQLVTVSTHEYYPVSVGTVPQNATITLPYGNFSASAAGTPYVSDPGTLTIAGYDGTRWTNLSATGSNTINTANRTVTVALPTALSTGYTALALASTSAANPLPVTLVAFTATVSGADALLSWTTASELRNDHFEVERSLDGASFGRIGQVAGHGTTATASSYSFRDASPRAGGLVYYRLRQVDTDGTGTYSPVRAVTFGPVVPTISLAPNPANATTTLDLTLLPAGSYHVYVLDATGRTVLEQWLAAGERPLLPVGRLASGTYLVRVSNASLSLSKRLVRE